MKVGILALGSHEERHGAALPPNTDAIIAEHIAREATKNSKADFLGVLKKSYELPGINTGVHYTLEELETEVKKSIEKARTEGYQGIILANAHGGNEDLNKKISEIEDVTQMRIIFNNTICKLEGPHAGTGELSIGKVIGITNESKLKEHLNLGKHPEVGFAGLKKAQEKYDWARKHAKEILENGVEVDEFLGKRILQCAIIDVINDTRDLASV